MTKEKKDLGILVWDKLSVQKNINRTPRDIQTDEINKSDIYLLHEERAPDQSKIGKCGNGVVPIHTKIPVNTERIKKQHTRWSSNWRVTIVQRKTGKTAASVLEE